jgi:uncharacterized membrane protein YkoI
MQRTKVIIGGAVVAAVALAGAGSALAAGVGDDREGPITGPAREQASAAALAATGGGRVTDTEVGDDESYYEVEVTLDDGSEVDVQLDENFNVVTSDVDRPDDDRDETDGPITGTAREQASAAALAAAGGGRVTDTEVRDDESYYEVEVTLDDGSEVDVQLDENFDVVTSHTDREDAEDDRDD